MKIVIAPDSFKESMSAKQASLAIEKGIHLYDKHIDTQLCPLADGGEGTLETLVESLEGTIKYYEVIGPLFKKIKAPIGFVNNCAIIECAKVCGLELLDESQKDPYKTTTFGLGELIRKALDHEVQQIMICLGGSATNDGGIGMMKALGVDFQNTDLQDVPLTMRGLKEIEYVNIQSLDSRIKDKTIIGVCDVSNPLCGKQGATYIYGFQKGVKLSEMEKIDQDMKHYADMIDEFYQQKLSLSPGSGAAGGLGFALLAFMQATLRSGFEVVSEMVHLEDMIAQCDKVIVGEGKMDCQTQYGKTPYGVLQIAQKYQKEVYAFAGKVEDDEILKQLGFQNVYPISPLSIPLNIALSQGITYLQECVYQHMEEMMNEI